MTLDTLSFRPSNVLGAAQDYLRRGWAPIPVYHGKKSPSSGCGWTQLRLAEEDLNDEVTTNMLNKTMGQVVQEFQPALNEIGLTKCPVCRRRATVFVAKSRRPFLNCSVCGVRIFYNGRESIRLLQGKLRLLPAHGNG